MQAQTRREDQLLKSMTVGGFLTEKVRLADSKRTIGIAVAGSFGVLCLLAGCEASSQRGASSEPSSLPIGQISTTGTTEVRPQRSAEVEWKRIVDKGGDLDAYESFVKEFPNAEQAETAKAWIQSYKTDANEYQAAMRLDTPEAYDAFLAKHPSSAFTNCARIRRLAHGLRVGMTVEEVDSVYNSHPNILAAHRAFQKGYDDLVAALKRSNPTASNPAERPQVTEYLSVGGRMGAMLKFVDGRFVCVEGVDAAEEVRRSHSGQSSTAPAGTFVR